MVDLVPLVTLVRDGGLALAVVVLVLGGVRGWYHWDREFVDMKSDRDYWRGIALKGADLAERALDAPAPRPK